MSSAQITPPAPVRAAFALYLTAAGLSLVNASLQMAFGFGGNPVLIGAIIEATLFVAFGVHMRAGRLWARLTMLSLSGVFFAFGVLALIVLVGAVGESRDPLAVLTLLFVSTKMALIGSAVWKMYRPANLGYFR